MPSGFVPHKFASDLLFSQDIYGPFSIFMLAAVIFFLLWLPRVQVMFPLVVFLFYVPYTQRFYVGGFNFDFMRIVCLFGWLRVWLRREKMGSPWNRLDTLMVAHGLAAVFFYTLLWQTPGAFFNMTARCFTMAGFYFLIRRWILDWDDIDRMVRYCVVLLIPLTALFVVEAITRSNPFAAVYPDLITVSERMGRYRCQGAFPHAILAGAFVATLAPLIGVQYWIRRDSLGQVRAVTGLLCTAFIILACASSTPILALAAGAVAFSLFRLRRWSPFFLPTTLLGLILLHVLMKAPVWSLISRASMVPGSTAYFRYMLIDRAIQHFGEWWLSGTKYPELWGTGLFDITNQFIAEGVIGGLGRLLLFLAMLYVSFSRIQDVIRHATLSREGSLRYWSLWVTLFTHVMIFMGVTYYGQNVQELFFVFAIVNTLTEPAITKTVARPGLRPRHRVAATPVTAAATGT